MLILNDNEVGELLDADLAFDAVREAFLASASGEAVNFPVVRERCDPFVFGIKSGVAHTHGALGLKAGGYWPQNAARGLPTHQSQVILFDPESGRPSALVAGGAITRLRTAAAAALSIDVGANVEARVLGVIGAGAQAEEHIRAALRVRKFARILLWNRSEDRVRALAGRLADLAAADIVSNRPALVGEADVLITLTPSTAPLVNAGWIKPGAHIAAMGSDTAGKQEIAPDALRRATLFTDSVAQSCTIGECQHAKELAPKLTELGALLRAGGRYQRQPGEITIYDGTGVALQDLLVAARLAERAAAQRIGQNITL